MGKAPNGLGKFSGKVGGVVFAISNGEQIVRAYQPVVSNPKSTGQLLQRSKGNLVGQLSSVVGRAAIVGMGENNRRRRAEFLRNALKQATAAEVGNNYKAILAPTKIQFSKGTVNPVVSVGAVTATASSITFDVSRLASTTDEEAARSIATVVVLAVSDDGNYKGCYVRSMSVPAAGVPTNVVINHLAGGAYSAYVYVIPCEMIDGSGLSISGLPMNLDATQLAAVLATSSYASQLSFGNSLMWSVGNFTPNAKDGDEEKTTRSKK